MGHLLETALEDLFPEQASRCTNFWRQEKRGIKVHGVVHRPGQIMIVAPGAYHWEFNAGFNIAEAINFASCGLAKSQSLSRWILSWVPPTIQVRALASLDERTIMALFPTEGPLSTETGKDDLRLYNQKIEWNNEQLQAVRKSRDTIK